MISDRTDLRIDVSGPKFDAESDFEVRLAVAPPKSINNDEKLISDTEKFLIFFSFLLCFWYRQASFKAQILTIHNSRRPQASCASEKFAK